VETGRRDVLRLLSSAAAGFALQPFECISTGLCPGGIDLAGFTPMCFTDAANARHQIYVTGASGPPVLLLHEISGLTPETLATARQLAAARYTVIVPLFFGQPGERLGLGSAGRICGDEQFACKRGERTSPHVSWLRELATCARQEWSDGKGVGVIGMCLTGAFPIAMLRAPEVVAPVLCQPTLPFNRRNPLQFFGWFTDQWALGLDPDDLEHAKTSTSMPILGIRYSNDRFCKKKRFERLFKEFPERFYRLDFPGKHHSTLVGDFCVDAFTEVLAFFNQHLRTTPDSCAGTFPLLSKRSLSEVVPQGCRGGTSGQPASGHHQALNTSKGTSCSSK
jgi:dienelactone hydrolase